MNLDYALSIIVRVKYKNMAVQKWINLDDQFPLREGNYLVWAKEYDELPFVAHYDGVHWQDFEFDEESAFRKITPYVSHWMSIPEPPQE